jgi:AhpC/TSA family
MLEAGDAAPDFTLPDQDGEELSLFSLRGETVVLYFIPAPTRRAVLPRPAAYAIVMPTTRPPARG